MQHFQFCQRLSDDCSFRQVTVVRQTTFSSEQAEQLARAFQLRYPVLTTFVRAAPVMLNRVAVAEE